MKQFVAEPEVASRIVESDFKLRPRTVEEVGPVNILLNQQRNAVGCTTHDVYIESINPSIKELETSLADKTAHI